MGKWSKEMVTERKPRGTVKRWLKTVRRSRDQGDKWWKPGARRLEL